LKIRIKERRNTSIAIKIEIREEMDESRKVKK
jgi:hypothetical protein